MNAIFTAVFLLSAITLLLYAPADFLPALLEGSSNAAKCALTLMGVYTVFMGLSAVAEESALTQRAARLLTPVCRRVFKTDDARAIESISMNVSCNLLGIGGAATPYGVKAIAALEESGNTFAQNLLFIINATSIQLIPTTVIALRAAHGSAAAHDITLPSFIATAVSTATGVLLYVAANAISTKRARRGTSKCST